MRGYPMRARREGFDAHYLLDLSLSDSSSPEITSVSLPDEGTESMAIISSFTIGFSEAMDVATVTNPANYELVGSGADGHAGYGGRRGLSARPRILFRRLQYFDVHQPASVAGRA